MITSDPSTAPRTSNTPPAVIDARARADVSCLFEDVRAVTDLANRFDLHDPLGDDARADRAMATSLRRIGRVAMLAAEVGARFEREGIPYDPAAWMHAPRTLFGGRAAIVACQDRAHFTRAMLMHGLGLGLDARAHDIDALVEDTGIVSDDDREHAPLVATADCRPPVPGLYTAVLAEVSEEGTVFAFHARVIDSREAFERDLEIRLGSTLFGKAAIRDGYDRGDPIVSASVSDAVDDMLVQVAEDPSSPLARGLDIVIEQRFSD